MAASSSVTSCRRTSSHFALLLACILLAASSDAWKVPSFPRAATLKATAAAVAASCALFTATNPPLAALAVSGGGKDYATKNLKGDESFAGADNRSKDFTQVDGKEVNFAKANLAGARFYRAQLEGAKFTGADLTGASLEDAGLDKADFTDAILKSSYLSSSFDAVGSIAGADFTDALLPEKTNKILCARPDASGTNSKTGADTRDSLMCP